MAWHVASVFTKTLGLVVSLAVPHVSPSAMQAQEDSHQLQPLVLAQAEHELPDTVHGSGH
jgi:hypothetical protein